MFHRRKPARYWFQGKDGRYYRNANLVLAEMNEIVAQPFWKQDFRRFAALDNEFYALHRAGPIWKSTLDKGDVVATRVQFRDAYPNNPILWKLDGSDNDDQG